MGGASSGGFEALQWPRPAAELQNPISAYESLKMQFWTHGKLAPKSIRMPKQSIFRTFQVTFWML